ncbi:putative cysteine desulfurase [Desulfonema limicola]|uniref:Cysteine desulfurase n=1 Tax=Desulfonema limicola TaxID=45656 RepID=A0A975B6N2_9BACT|nr:aminotransferase class V-fold PLP-dependent enzyme [Desulfonema limicola]QTA79810.1 putative cysteine desulfurase [Desulfonema limicola]
MTFNFDDIRKEFAFFRQHDDICYLDYAATTFIPDRVINAWSNYQKNIGVSAHRNRSWLGCKAIKELELSRFEIKRFFNAQNIYNLVFLKNATEAINTVAFGLRKFIKAGDIILTTSLEHHSNYLPWKRLTKEMSAILIQIPILPSGNLDFSILSKLKNQDIKIISICHTSNVTGHQVDLEKFRLFAQQEKAFFIVDSSQASGHSSFNAEQIDADAYAFSAHKMYGPKNIGGLLIKKNLLEEFSPMLLGGGMVWKLGNEGDEWVSGPEKLEAGTLDVGLAIAWREACRFIEEIGLSNIQYNEAILAKMLREALKNIKGINIICGGKNWSSAITSFEHNCIHSHDLEHFLGEKKVIIRTGHLCSQNTLMHLGKNSVNRISLGIGVREKDIDLLIKILKRL